MFVVAGASGHVGSVVANALLAQGKSVKVIVRNQDKGRIWSNKGAEVAIGSLEDSSFLASVLKGASGFFALIPPNLAVADFYAWQRETAQTIASAVKTSGVPHVVMLSSIGADQSDGTGPIKGLHHLENALRATGCKTTAIRAGFFQENIAGNLAPAKTAGIYPSFAPADLATPMIATKDIGELAASCFLSTPAKSETIDLYGPAYSSRELALKLGHALGKTLQVVEIPPSAHVDAFIGAGFPKQFAEAYAEMYAGFASGRIGLVGDRKVEGKTTIDALITALAS